MKQLLITTAVLVMTSAFAVQAFAGDDMSGMRMPMKPSVAATPAAALTEAEVRRVDAATGMITLKHGAFANIGMAPMTMAYKAKDAAMLGQVRAGDKVKVRVEDVGGTLTIVRLVKDAS
jgi:Cu(I)/Ag(I) efflux system periplasmic protein CusF